MTPKVDNPISQRAAASIHASEQDAKSAFETKKAEYDAAMKQYYEQKTQLWFAERNYMYNKKDDECKNKYFQIKNSSSDAGMNADVLRDSVNNKLWHLSKVQTSASIFDSAMG